MGRASNREWMVARTQRLIDLSRTLLSRSRQVAAHLLDSPQAPRRPLVIEGTPAPRPSAPAEGLPVPVDDTLAAVCANVAL
ncbi:hypothetical protein ACFSXZ_27585, partial [Amycolatopsis pigmentata]